MTTAAVARTPLALSLARVRLRLAGRDPLVLVVGWLGFVAGVAAAIVPTGIQAHLAGAGVLGGLSYGVDAGAAAYPISAVAGVLVFAARDETTLMSQALLMCGLSRAAQTIGNLLSALIVSLVVVPAAALGGAICGLGDSLRQGSSVLGAGHVGTGLVVALAGGSALAWDTAALVVAARRPVRATCAILLGLVSFLPLVLGLRGTALAGLPALHPLAPLWAAAGVGGYFALVMATWLQIAVTIGWAAVAAVVIAADRRGSRAL